MRAVRARIQEVHWRPIMPAGVLMPSLMLPQELLSPALACSAAPCPLPCERVATLAHLLLAHVAADRAAHALLLIHLKLGKRLSKLLLSGLKAGRVVCMSKRTVPEAAARSLGRTRLVLVR